MASAPQPLRLTEPLVQPLSVLPDASAQDLDALRARLMAAPFGYSQVNAQRLLEHYPVERIEAGMANLRFRPEVHNPAGYLLRELQAGGYSPPAGHSSFRRRAVLQVVPDAPDPVVAQEKAAAEDRLQAALATLDDATRQAWFLEARMHHARLSGKPVEKVPEDSILVQAAFENLVCQRLLAA